MTNNGEGYVQVGVDVDDQSFAQLNSSVNTATNNLNRMAQANSAVADTADDIAASYKGAWASVAASIKGANDELEQYMADISRTAELDKLVADPFGDGSGGGGGGGGSGGGGSYGTSRGFSSAAALARQAGAPGLAGGLQVTGEVLRVQKAFGGITDALDGITKAGGPATDIIRDMGGDLGVFAVAGGAAIVAIGGIIAAGAAFKAELDNDSKGLSDAVVQVNDYYKAIENGTTASIKAQLEKAKADQIAQQGLVDTLQAGYNAAHPAPKITDNETADVGAAFTGIVSDLSSGGKDLNKSLQDAQKNLSDTKNQITALNQALGSSDVAANDAIAAQNNYVKALEANKTHTQQLADFEATANSKQIQDKITANKNQITADSDLYASLSTITNPTKETTAEITRLHGEIDQLTNDDKQLSGAALEAAKAHEAETAAIEKASKAVTDHADAVQKQEQSEVDVVNKYNDSVQAAEDSAAQARLTANQKLQDALVKAAQTAVDASQKALDQLEQKQASNLESLNQDLDKQSRDSANTQLDDQVKAQRQERDDLQTHLQNLQQIRDADASRTRDDLLNRNYRDLFSQGEQKTQDMNSENNRYAQQEQARNQSLNDELSDVQRNAAQQKQERLISYQQANADAQKQYQTELVQAQQAKQKTIQAAQQAEQKELSDINASAVQKENLLKTDAINQLKILQQTEDEKQQIFLNGLAQVNQMLGAGAGTGVNAPSTFGGHSSFTPYAAGGSVSAYQPVTVNDGNSRESFNNSMFPPGLGLFIPSQSGTISPGSGGGNGPQSQSNTFYIKSNDPAGVRREVLSVLKEVTR